MWSVRLKFSTPKKKKTSNIVKAQSPPPSNLTAVVAPFAKMHLMYNSDPSGKRIYTLQKVMDSRVTKSAHPARFSPDDKWSRHRVTMRKRFGVLLDAYKESMWLPLCGNYGICVFGLLTLGFL